MSSPNAIAPRPEDNAHIALAFLSGFLAGVLAVFVAARKEECNSSVNAGLEAAPLQANEPCVSEPRQIPIA